MSYDFVVDSYAWIEYFMGSKAGEKAKRYVEGGKAATATITIAELKEKYLREGWEFFDEDLSFIASTTLLVNLDKNISVRSGEVNASMKTMIKGWGMADSIILATAQVENARVITGDEHFRGLKEAIFIK